MRVRAGGYGEIVVPTTRQLRLGFHVYPSIQADNEPHVFAFEGVARADLVGVRASGISNTLQLKVAGTVRDTLLNAMPPGQWYKFGVDAKLASSGGWVKIYLDGVEILSYTGDTGNSDIRFVLCPGFTYNGFTSYWYYDDLYLDDLTSEGAAAVPPDIRLEYLIPNGDGNYSQWDGSDGNQVNNWEQVDEQPHDSDTSYNEAQAAEEKDSYAMSTHALSTGWSIKAVIPCAYVRKTDGGVASKIALMLRENAVDWEGIAQDLPTSYGLIWERRTLDPGGAAWDQDSLDAVEVGACAEGAFA